VPEEVGAWEGDLGGKCGAGDEGCHCFWLLGMPIGGALLVVEVEGDEAEVTKF